MLGYEITIKRLTEKLEKAEAEIKRLKEEVPILGGSTAIPKRLYDAMVIQGQRKNIERLKKELSAFTEPGKD